MWNRRKIRPVHVRGETAANSEYSESRKERERGGGGGVDQRRQRTHLMRERMNEASITTAINASTTIAHV